MSALPIVAVTAGEPAGIGPDLCVVLAHCALDARIVVLGDVEVLRARAAMLGRDIEIIDATEIPPHREGALCVQHVPTVVPVIPGQLEVRNSTHVLSLLDAAIEGCGVNRYHALVTAPVHKGIINDAGLAFTGHTEYLAQQTATQLSLIHI